MKITFWLVRLIPALILLQTLFFKFTGAAESVYIFSKLGVEPWGRIGSGVAELIAGILLLIPRFSVVGAALALGIMGGAILSHLAILGISIMDDGGYLFFLAVVTAVCSAIIIYQNRADIQDFLSKK
jgi:putative oxidoreductase